MPRSIAGHEDLSICRPTCKAIVAIRFSGDVIVVLSIRVKAFVTEGFLYTVSRRLKEGSRAV